MGITFKPKLQVYCLDLASISSIRECAKNMNKKESKIDILINNAGNYILKGAPSILKTHSKHNCSNLSIKFI